MKAELTLIPHATIHPRHIVLYNEKQWSPHRPVSRKSELIIAGKSYSNNKFINSTRSAEGKVSVTAKRKMIKAVDYLLYLSNEKKVSGYQSGKSFKFKIAFITLTLPSKQVHSDNEIKEKCLNQFLIEIKKFYKVKNYVWRAEQQNNSNIHFHIVIDKFIPYQELRDRWNRIVEKLNYVSQYREEQKAWHKLGFRPRENLLKTWSLKKQIAAYERGAKFNWHSPNSTDIHSIQKIHNLKAYIVKYMTKQPEETKETKETEETKKKQQGRIWGCNYELSNVKGAQLIVDSQTENELIKILNDDKFYKYKGDYFTCINITPEDLENINCDVLFKSFANYIFNTFDKSIQRSFIT